MRNSTATVLRSVVAAGVLALAPVTFHQTEGITVTEACAGEGCCKNPNGICDTSAGIITGYEERSWVQIVFGCGDAEQT